MASNFANPLLTFIRRIAASHSHSQASDGELLQRFALYREEAAFEMLMHRHGPMVLSVCRSILHDPHDAEDVFQATFLILVRKPAAIGKPASVASWLHGVALRLANKARVQAGRRRALEREAPAMNRGEPQNEVVWSDLRPVLHQEVERLPHRYRLPFVLCCLEGKTNEEAAVLLGCPRGTVQSNLSRARERLRQRLTQRGVTVTGALLASAFGAETKAALVPAALAEGTLKAALAFTAGSGAAGAIAAPVLGYANGMLRAAQLARLTWALVLMLPVALGTGAALIAARTPAHAPLFHETVSSASGALESPPPRVTDRERLQGAWRIATVEASGRRTDALRGRRLVFAGDRFNLSEGEGEIPGIFRSSQMEGDFTLTTNNPSWIDFVERAPFRWQLCGVYDLDGRKLLLSLRNKVDGQRPLAFTAEPESNQVLLTLERD